MSDVLNENENIGESVNINADADGNAGAGKDTPKNGKAAEQSSGKGMSFKEALLSNVFEDEPIQAASASLTKLLGGAFLTSGMLRKQAGVIILTLVFVIFYVANRYSCQKLLLEIDNLEEELKDAKYKSMSSASELTEQSRETNILQLLKQGKDSTVKVSSEPPYIIKVPKK